MVKVPSPPPPFDRQISGPARLLSLLTVRLAALVSLAHSQGERASHWARSHHLTYSHLTGAVLYLTGAREGRLQIRRCLCVWPGPQAHVPTVFVTTHRRMVTLTLTLTLTLALTRHTQEQRPAAGHRRRCSVRRWPARHDAGKGQAPLLDAQDPTPTLIVTVTLTLDLTTTLNCNQVKGRYSMS